MRENCFICSFWQKDNPSILAILHHYWHSFPIRSELQNFQGFILNCRSIELDLCNLLVKIISSFPQVEPIYCNSQNLLPRVFEFLLTKTICSWAAAWTSASSSWDCALYKILPLLLQTIEEVHTISASKVINVCFCFRQKISVPQIQSVTEKCEGYLRIGMTVLHIAITVRKRITSEEPLATAFMSSSSACQRIEFIRNWSSYIVLKIWKRS